MNNMRIRSMALSATVLAVLAACGGGGGDSGTGLYGSESTGTTGTSTSGTTGSSGTTTTTGSTSSGSTAGGGITEVSTGVPNQRFMSISVEKYALDWSLDGDKTKVTIRVADSAGNPVPADTPVQFSTNGGQIQTSCKLSGVASGTAPLSECSVDFTTQDYRPGSGLVAIVAWLPGEEAYKDLNANGQYDVGEPYIDSGKLFRDDNLSGNYTPAVDELIASSASSGSIGIGTSACSTDALVPVNDEPLSVPDTCDGAWGKTLVRASVTLPVSDPRRLVVTSPQAKQVVVASDFGTNLVAAPAGTTVTVDKAPTGCSVLISPASVPATAVGPTIHRLTSSSNTPNACVGSVSVAVKFGDYQELIDVNL